MLTLILIIGVLVVIAIEVISWHVPKNSLEQLRLNLDQGTYDDEDGNVIYDLEDLDE